MKRHCKKIALILVFLFSLPIITAACCCTQYLFKKEASSCHSRQEQPGSSRDHKICGHSPIVGNLTASDTFILGKDVNNKFLRYYFFQQETSSIVPDNARFLASDPGPPGSDLIQIPIYLQISSFRI